MFVRSLPDHRWLDRIVRGRVWIPLFGVLLLAIVGVQVEILKLGAGVGRSTSLATQLESRDELLRASVAVLSGEDRIERAASAMGMRMPGPTEVKFVEAGGSAAVQRAIRGITRPDTATFTANLATVEAADAPVAPPQLPTETTSAAATSSTSPTTSATTTTTTDPATSATSADPATSSDSTTPATSTDSTAPTTPATSTAPTTPTGSSGASGGASLSGG